MRTVHPVQLQLGTRTTDAGRIGCEWRVMCRGVVSSRHTSKRAAVAALKAARKAFDSTR